MGWLLVGLMIGYIVGRVRPMRRFFPKAPPPPPSDDAHVRTVLDPDGKPVRLFEPMSNC